MQAHANAENVGMDLIPLGPRQRFLRPQSRSDAPLAGFESRVETVTGGLNDQAPAVLDGAAQDVIMTRQSRPHLLWKLLPKPGAAFNVRE
jgi:hypothetical protein